MRNLRWYDWLGGLAIWTAASFLVGVVMDETGAPEEGTIIVAFGLWSLGIVAARVWWLKRAGADEDSSPRVGLSTGEMTAQRLADMEARVYELEERLELAERLLAEARERPRIPRIREDTPV
ncbi:MAG: hypothetical protein KJZ47_03575 [Gemmatimonadales bacterium]|nr:hypothetical protein [Gemmatimonadales bacterium]